MAILKLHPNQETGILDLDALQARLGRAETIGNGTFSESVMPQRLQVLQGDEHVPRSVPDLSDRGGTAAYVGDGLWVDGDIVREPAGLGGQDGYDYTRVCAVHRWASHRIPDQALASDCVLCLAELDAAAGRKRYQALHARLASR